MLACCLGDAIAIDTAAKRVVLADGEIDFDYLIVAAGLTHSYFGNSAWAQHAPGLKTLDDALEIRRRILIAFERAEREPDPAKRAAWLTFVVIGGGPTGVELAGTLAEIARHTLTDEFRSIDPAKASVLLLEGGVAHSEYLSRSVVGKGRATVAATRRRGARRRACKRRRRCGSVDNCG